MSQTKNSQLKNYDNYAAMLLDISHLSKELDLDATLNKAPDFSFYTKNGMIHLGSSFQHMLHNMKSVLGIGVNPEVSRQHMGMYTLSYEDYSPVKDKELPTIKVNDVDSPAKKRATRAKAKE